MTEAPEHPAAPAARPPWWRRAPAELAKLYLSACLVVALVGPVTMSAGFRLGPSAAADLFSPRATDVAFPTADGLTLRGVYCPPQGRRPVVLLAHGIRANRRDLVPWARILIDAGYGVLAFDWRGHGLSDGWWISYGAQEGADLEAADAFLDARPELAGLPRGVIAVSLGAGMTAQHAQRLGPEYRCLVLDSPYGDLRRMADFRLGRLGPLGWLPSALLQRTGGLWLGTSLADLAPEQGVRAFAPRPLMVLHGEADDVIPIAEGRSLYEAYPGPKQSWFNVHGHTEARWEELDEWRRRVGGFLAAHLPGGPALTSGSAPAQ